MSPVIYKISSPSKKVYVGQSINVELRLRSYRSANCRKQKKLFASIRKHGWESHEFSIIHTLPIDCGQQILNDYEQLYMDLYNSAGIELLNTRQAGSNGRHSEESIIKMRGKCGIHMKGRKIPFESIEKTRAKTTGLKRSAESIERYRRSRMGSSNPMFGKKPWNTRLSDAQVKEIREYPVLKKYGHVKKLAILYNVSSSTISAILSLRMHKNV